MPFPSTVERLPLPPQCLGFSPHPHAPTSNTADPPVCQASQVAPQVHLSPQCPLGRLCQEAQGGMGHQYCHPGVNPVPTLPEAMWACLMGAFVGSVAG